MTDAPDAELLEQFVRNRSEAAFAEMVRRHVNLVYSTALRHTGNAHAAEDITQAVFIILARKAMSLGRETVLPGWLYHTARLTAANWRRAEVRRVRREQEVFMQSTLEESAPNDAWRELSPLLDDAMAKLRGKDRDAIVLRYFQNQSLASVGAALGVEERAAQKRVARALEKLRTFFARRGVASTTAIIAGVVSANAVQAAPVGLAAAVTATAAKGATISATITALVKGTMKMMTWLKIKFAVGIGTAALLMGGATITIGKISKHLPQPARSISILYVLPGQTIDSNTPAQIPGPAVLVGPDNRMMNLPTTGANPTTSINLEYATSELTNAGNATVETAAQTVLGMVLSHNRTGFDQYSRIPPSSSSSRSDLFETLTTQFSGASRITLMWWLPMGDDRRMVFVHPSWPEGVDLREKPVAGSLIFRSVGNRWYLEQFTPHARPEMNFKTGTMQVTPPKKIGW